VRTNIDETKAADIFERVGRRLFTSAICIVDTRHKQRFISKTFFFSKVDNALFGVIVAPYENKFNESSYFHHHRQFRDDRLQKNYFLRN
jgi:hypothetical protein